MLINPIHSEMILFEPEDVVTATVPGAVAMRSVMDWTHSFLTQPHPDLGREGTVCPFTAPALKRKVFWLALSSATSYEGISNDAKKYRDWFLTLESEEPLSSHLKTILILFMEISTSALPLIDKAQAELRPEFTGLGMMLGEFHQLTNKGGLRNSAFRPLRSPVPMLVIRRMVESDFPFLKEDRRCLPDFISLFGVPCTDF